MNQVLAQSLHYAIKWFAFWAFREAVFMK